jgi:hypothetical protein
MTPLEEVTQKAFGNGYIAAMSDVLKVMKSTFDRLEDKQLNAEYNLLLAEYTLTLAAEIAKQKEVMELNNFNYNYDQQ